MNDNSEIQNKNYKIFLIAFFVILALPLLAIPPWFHPAAWGKTIVFRIIVSILLFFLAWQVISKKTDNRVLATAKSVLSKKNKAFWPFWFLIALLGIFLLASVFSLDRTFSFWGSPYRAGGFINFASYIVLAVLAFLILRKQDWQKIWDFSIFIGVLVSIIAVFQKLGIFSKILIPFSGRPPSTIGGATFLAAYLLLLTFLTFSFALKEKNWLKKFFYFSAVLLFLYVILITEGRAAYLGLLVGFFYFLFLYSVNLIHPKRRTLFLLLKILAGILLIMAAYYGVYYLNNQLERPQFILNNQILRETVDRLSITLVLGEPRYSTWKVSLEALKARPILGYGPENFSIAFDKYYDPSLPYITKAWGSWWDRAHNFLFDISIAAGIPALIIYLSLFAALFWKLQKVKEKQTEQALICHGIQATFFAYLAANFFSFDSFSTYLISFLLISYSLHLISLDTAEQFNVVQRKIQRKFGDKIIKLRKLTVISLLIILIWFIWSFNIKPLQINRQINLAQYSVNNKKCDQGLEKIDNTLSQKSYIDSYLRLKYIDFMKECASFYPEKNYEYAEKGVGLLKQNLEIQPTFTRNWIFLAGFTSVLVDKEKNQEERGKLIEEAEYYLKKAQELSPKHQEILIEWAKLYLAAQDYQKIKEKSEQCLNLNLDIANCYWYLGLSEIFLGEGEMAEKHLIEAKKKEYPTESSSSLEQLNLAYSAVKDYEKLVLVYQRLIELKPEEAQLYASLAFVFREIKDYEKAKEYALLFLELKPEAKEEVELFLKTLK